MSFLAPKQNLPTQAPERQPYQVKGPVPVPYGVHRIAGTFLDHPWNHWFEGTGSHGQPDAVYYSFAQEICPGPVKALRRIWVNGKVALNVFVDADDSTSEWYHDMEIPWYVGKHTPLRFRIYWGKPGQPSADILTGTRQFGYMPSPNPHPAYEGKCYIIWYSYETGWPTNARDGGATIQPLEYEIERRPEVITTSADSIHGVSFVGVAYDMLKNPRYGMNMDVLDAEIIEDEWQAKADQMAEEGYHRVPGAESGLSPVFSDQRDLETALADLLSYVDGFIYQRDGKIRIDWFPNRGGIELDDLPVISRHDMLEEPRQQPGDWEDTLNIIEATFTPVDTLEPVPVLANSSYNREIVLERRPKTFETPWFRTYAQAYFFAQRTKARLHRPLQSGRITTSRSKARNLDGSPLLEGDLFRLNVDKWELDLAVRLVERIDKEDGSVELEWKVEPGQWPEAYVEPPDDRELPINAPPMPIESWQPVRWPISWGGPGIAFLAARPHRSTISANIWIDQSNTWSGDEGLLGALTTFATPCTLKDYRDSSDTLFTLTLQSEDYASRILHSRSAAEQANDEMILYIGGEFISLGELTDNGDSTYTWSCLRGRGETFPGSHFEDTQGWIFFRQDIELFHHPYLYNRMGNFYLRLVAFTVLGAAEASAAMPLASPAAPTIEFDPAPVDRVWAGNWWESRQFEAGLTITGELRRVWVTHWWSDEDDDNVTPPQGDYTYQKRPLQFHEFQDVRPRTLELDLVLDLSHDRGWNAISVWVEDALGDRYTVNADGWLFVRPIPAPDLLTAVAFNNRVRIQWEHPLWSTEVSRFSVSTGWRSIGIFPGTDNPVPGAMRTHWDEGLAQGTYDYRIRRVAANATMSDWSYIASATIGSAFAPGTWLGTVEAPTLTKISGTQIDLTLKKGPAGRFAFYRVHYSYNGGPASVILEYDDHLTTWSHIGLPAGFHDYHTTGVTLEGVSSEVASYNSIMTP